jgi:protein transport protein SEC23
MLARLASPRVITAECIALQEIGVGDTCAWKIAGLDPLTTFGVYLEVVNQHTQPIAQQYGLVQFITQFQACNGQRRVRVSTVARKCVVYCGVVQCTGLFPYLTGAMSIVIHSPLTNRSWANANVGREYVAAGFDQEAAAVMMARIAVFRAENDDGADVLRWLDRMLIRLVRLVKIGLRIQ